MVREFTCRCPLPSSAIRSPLRRMAAMAGVALLTMPVSSLRADTIYKSVDANGQVVYSDHVDPSLTQTTVVHLEGTPLNTMPGTPVDPDASAAAEAWDSGDSGVAAVSTTVAPPPLEDEQPTAAIQEGFLWTPGYWYWGGQGYYWVRGAWVRPPRPGMPWAPPYWGRTGARYVFHPGHWGRPAVAHAGPAGSPSATEDSAALRRAAPAPARNTAVSTPKNNRIKEPRPPAHLP